MEFPWQAKINESYESLKKALVSGQCFRADSYEEETVFVYGTGLYRLKSVGKASMIEGNIPLDINRFFDLDRDYRAVEIYLIQLDESMKKAVKQFQGLRILEQDPFEMVLTFIISQSKQISQIKILVERLSELYGTFIGEYCDKAYYSFPTPQQLASVDESVYRALKMGYRSAYLVDAVEKVLDKEVNLKDIVEMPYEEALKMLMTIKGVGEKVADCVLLYGYGNFIAFPVDVWIERIIGELYFTEKPGKKALKSFIREHFTPLGGIAQQYLFEYGRWLHQKA